MRLQMYQLRHLIKEGIRQDRKSNNGPFKWSEFARLAAEGDDEVGRRLVDRIETAKWYARWRLKKLGSGAARTAYLLTPKTVLKVANDLSGIQQNKHEVEVSSHVPAGVPIAHVKQHDSDGVWVVSELIRPVKDEVEFEHLSGHSVGDLYDALEALQLEHPSQQGELDPFVLGAWQAVKHGDLALVDVANVEHWGITADRKLVLLDYGYTQDMYDSLPGWAKDDVSARLRR